MKILIASSEVHPYSKTGGLADMVGALGKALARAGHRVGLITPLYAGVRERFPARQVVSLHSALTPAERARNWLAVLTGSAEVVLGTRLAVFAPLVRPGLIVVDEEHDPSFKQE